MMERKAILAKPKHQYRVSQYGERDYSAYNKKNRDYCKNYHLSQLTDKL